MPKKIVGVDEFSADIFSPSKGERDYDNTIFYTIQNVTNRSVWCKNRITEIDDLIDEEILNQTRIYAEAGIPSPTLGTDGSLYIDTNTTKFYYKRSDTWEVVLDPTSFGQLDSINDVTPVDKNIDIEVGTGLEIDNTVDGKITISLYVTPVASLSGGSLNEKGATVTSVPLTWTYNKTEVSQSINQSIGSIAVGLRNYTHITNITTNRTYTLTISDGTTPVTSNTSVTFQNKSHWGTSASTSLTSAQILSLANAAFDTNRNTSFTLDGNGEYLYYAYPASYGAATFTVNGLLNTAWTPTVVSHTNASGHTENYNVYRSNTIQNGSDISVGVS